ncbi:hypothetical protein HPB50_014042 [Hyalomma asiaticum]|uniref:Uncharacterized protein n=1 Tax=Hyalomma asiaticum TaxID=266040 RepID=A0ACB7THX9_HYAAI|nr:hypothetical protein HPB50_014042 [Hyalomma asiaticum]
MECQIRTQRDTPHCSRCGVFGRRTDTCTAVCRRLGGAHATVDCTSRKSYIDDTAAEESCLDGGWRYSTGNRTVVAKGSQSGNKLSIKEKAAPGNGGEAQQSWWDKKGEDDSCVTSQPMRNEQSSGPLEPEKTKKMPGDDASQNTPSGLSKQQSALAATSKPAPQHGGASQQRGREDERHGY